jgi:pimeloyl-ACP methyl ester carboxylesterase
MERVEIPVGDFVFDATAAGPRDGELVILLHGFPQTSHAWRHQLPALAEAGYRVIAPDQRGYSPRARPAELEQYRIEHLVADVLAIADWEGGHRFHLAGHDWGAAVSWAVAGWYGPRLRSLTVLSVPHPLAFARALGGAGGSDQAARSGYMTFFRTEGAEDQMLANDAQGLRNLFQGSGLSAEDAREYLAALGTPEALGAALNWYRAVDLGSAEGHEPITTATLFVWSTDDPALGREGAELTAEYVEGPYRFEVLEGVNHWIPEMAPDQLNRLLVDHLAAAE